MWRRGGLAVRGAAAAAAVEGAPSSATVRLAARGRDITLVGVIHLENGPVMEAQARLIREAVREAAPQSVLVELCRARLEAFEPRWTDEREDPKWAQAPGAEFGVAVREARRAGARLVLGDLPHDRIEADLAATRVSPRLWRALREGRAGEAASLVPQAASEAWQDLVMAYRAHHTARDAVAAAEAGELGLDARALARALADEVRRRDPEYARVMMDRRDRHMAAELLGRCRGPAVVAVVGAGHLDGMERALLQAGAKPRLDLGAIGEAAAEAARR